MKIRAGATRNVSLMVDDDLNGAAERGLPEIKLHLFLDDAAGSAMSAIGESLAVALNGRALRDGRARKETKYTAGDKTGAFTDDYLEYVVPPPFVRTGENRFEFNLRGSTVTVLRLRDLQLWIFHRPR